MRELNDQDVTSVSGGLISRETIGCAIGGALASPGGAAASAVGCMLGALIANNANGTYTNNLGNQNLMRDHMK